VIADARFLAFELKPKPALSRRLVSAKQREDGSVWGTKQPASIPVCVKSE
jgi:hypothetical protein